MFIFFLVFTTCGYKSLVLLSFVVYLVEGAQLEEHPKHDPTSVQGGGFSGFALIFVKIPISVRLPTPPMETPDPPSDIPGASKQVVLTPHDIPRSLRV